MRSCLAFLVVNLAACHGWSFCIWSLMMYSFGIGKSSDRSCAWHCFWALRTTFKAHTLLNKHFTSPTQRLFSIFYVGNIESSKPRSSQTEAIFHNLCFKIQTASSRLIPTFQHVVKVLHMIRLESCRNLTGCAYESSEPWPGQTYDDWWSISEKKR